MRKYKKMRIHAESVENMNCIGIYAITTNSGMRYIGHSKTSFSSRYKTHTEKLPSSHHPNIYLQETYNEIGIEQFYFEIIEVLPPDTVDFETPEGKWIEFYESWDRSKGFNINRYPGQSPIYTQEVRDRVSASLKRRYREGRMQASEDTQFKPGLVVWNKGKKYKSTDHLKVPKKVLGDRSKDKLTKRTNASEIEVYHNGTLLGTWRSAKDLEEWSLTPENNLPIKSRFKDPRMGKPIKLLQSVNINKSCTYGKPYKGLHFKFKNSTQLTMSFAA